MRCKYEGSGIFSGRCMGTREVDPCPGHDKCGMFKPAGCELCSAEWIDIDVRTVNPDDTYVFSTHEAIGLQFCPMCGRKLGG